MTSTVGTLWLGGVVALGKSRVNAGRGSWARAVAVFVLRQLLMSALMAAAAPQPALAKPPRSFRYEPRALDVHITWRIGSLANDEQEQEMELNVGKREFEGLIAGLELATRKKCGRIEPTTSGQGK